MGRRRGEAIAFARKNAKHTEFAKALEELQAQLTTAADRGPGAQASRAASVDGANASGVGGEGGGGEHAKAVLACKQKLLLQHRRSIGPY